MTRIYLALCLLLAGVNTAIAGPDSATPWCEYFDSVCESLGPLEQAYIGAYAPGATDSLPAAHMRLAALGAGEFQHWVTWPIHGLRIESLEVELFAREAGSRSVENLVADMALSDFFATPVFCASAPSIIRIIVPQIEVVSREVVYEPSG